MDFLIKRTDDDWFNLPKNIFEILIRAATQRDSIENTTKVLKNVRSLFTVRLILLDFCGLFISQTYYLSQAISFFTFSKKLYHTLLYYFLAMATPAEGIAKLFGLLQVTNLN